MSRGIESEAAATVPEEAVHSGDPIPMHDGGRVLYHAYETRRRLVVPLYGMAAITDEFVRLLPQPADSTKIARSVSAWSQTVAALKVTHTRPDFRIESAVVDGKPVAVHEEPVLSTPFATLLRFAKASEVKQPPVLVLPGLAGHFATLVRDSIKTMLPDHDVYVADWHNARDVPRQAGCFGLDEFIEHIIGFLAEIGPGAHLVAICQPCPAALAAAALMAEDDHTAEPRSIVLMAGPVDARVNPGVIESFAQRYPMAVLKRAVITTVPWPHRGHGRRVYPGFLQLAGFLGLDPMRHTSAFANLFRDIATGKPPSETTQPFYAEFFAVLDIAAEFYLETARAVFRDHDLARGELRWRGRLVDPSLIGTALLTIEAEHDEMCPPGQTRAAHELCPNIPDERRRHLLQQGVGHYGVFSGSRFRAEIYPEIRDFIAAMDAAPAGSAKRAKATKSG